MNGHDPLADDERLFDLLLEGERPAAATENLPAAHVPAAAEPGALSNFQRRLWLVQQMEPGGTAYLMPCHLSLRGPLHLPALKQALLLLWRRHETLRSIYPVREGMPRCEALPDDVFALSEFDFSSAPDRWREHYLSSVLRPMDLASGPLLRAALYRLAPAEHALLLDIHHINGDGASLAVLREELFAAYAACALGREPDLPPLGAGYADFVRLERSRAGRSSEALAERLKTLADAPTQIDFLFDKPLPERFTFRGEGRTLTLDDPERLRQAFERGRTLGLSPFMVSLAAFGATLHRHTGQEVLLVGTPVSTRTQDRFARTVGFFVNTCVARLDFSGDPTLEEVLRRTRAGVSEMLRHPELQLDELVKALCRERPLARPALLQATFSFLDEEPVAVPGLPGGLKVEALQIERDSSMFELTLDLSLRDGRCCCYLESYRDAFAGESARRFLVHFRRFLDAIAADPKTRVSDVPLFGPEAASACRSTLAGPSLALSPDTLCAVLRRHARNSPDAPALVCGDSVLSFSQLARRVALRRGQLAAAGLLPGAVLALACSPGEDWTTTALAALESGATVLPLDTASPVGRLNAILENAGATLLWHDENFDASRLDGSAGCRLLCAARAPAAAEVDAPPLVAPSDTAYLIYTSGTTGQPKGVRVSHAALAAHLRSASLAYEYTPADRALAFAPAHFDAFWEQLFTPLFAGASVLAEAAALWAPDELCRHARLRCITVLDLPPQYLREVLYYLETNPGQAPAGLRLVIAGGEAMPSALASAWQVGPLGQVPLLNAYGPTEAVVTATVYRIDKSARTSTANGVAPIGFPLPGRLLRLLDAQGREVGEGIGGELYIGGPALAEGYHDDAARTAQGFRHWLRTDDGGRFCSADEPGALRLYRTGDRVRLGPDGALEFLGRMDQQLKLRGFRIEPGEIESVLSRHSSVAQAFVTVFEKAGTGPQLVAYALPRPGAAPATEELMEWLSRWLPGHMRPAAIVLVERFPTLASGKIDSARLPRPEFRSSETAAAASRPPEGELERRIAALWSEVLGRREVGENDNFFDLGGQSLLLVRLHTRLSAELGAKLRLVDLFANPTVSRQARLLRGEERTSARRGRRTLRGDVAVVGLAGRFPGADNVDELWQNLVAGRESIRFFSQEEMAEAGVPESLRTRPDYVPAHGYLGGERNFDAAFFGYSPHDAALIDPQQRLFLEECWHALESAGCDPDRFAGDIGVYAGMGFSQYLVRNLARRMDGGLDAEAYATSLGVDKDFIASRVCYKLNLRGPGVNVNTACSTSLVAIHAAAQALLGGECDMALAGGVTLLLPGRSGYLYSPGNIASPDGHCRAFSEDAGGTVGGSGCAVVCLMRLEDALAGGHLVRAVLKGSAINNDGADKVGFTAPGVRRQRDVIRAALDQAGVDAREVQMVEAHGTGTSLGDPIEVQALSEAFATDQVPQQSCWIGSLKTNVGHLDTAAGAAGFIKAVLALEHGIVPASLHCSRPSAKIDFPRTPFRVAQTSMPWPSCRRRHAGVSSFGIGGTNAHVILEEAPVRESRPSSGSWCLPLSAASETSLLAQARALAAWLVAHPEAAPADLLRTLVAGRRRFPVRVVVFAERLAEAVTHLENLSADALLRCDRDGRPLSGSGCVGTPPEPFAELCRSWLTGKLEAATAALQPGGLLVPLPGYVFEREEYWIDAPGPRSAESSKLPEENWFRYPAWEDLPRRYEPETSAEPLAVIVAPGGAAAQRWLERGRSAGLAFSVRSSGEELARAVRDGSLSGSLLHLGALDVAGSLAQRLALLLADLRALAAADRNRPFALTLLHPGLADDPALSYLDAVRCVVPHEYPNLAVRVLRAPVEASPADFRSVRTTALADLGERQLAVEGSRLRRLAHLALPGLAAEAGAARLRAGGLYLITGGLGGLGLTFARLLAERCKARLVLVARHAPGPDEAASLLELEKKGAQVFTAVLDVADAPALKAFIARTRDAHGRIDGVIHAAGVGGGSLIGRTGEAEIARTLRAKVEGTRSLADALAGAPLDFVVLCSSLTAVLGGPGQAAYAAANAWMDAFARERAAEGQPWISIRWDAWTEVGMAARAFAVAGRSLREWTFAPEDYWPWAEHRIGGRPTLPGTAFLELFAQALGGEMPLALDGLTLLEPLVHEGGPLRPWSVLDNAGELSFVSGSGSERRVHAVARRASASAAADVETLAAVRLRCTRPVEALAEAAPEIAVEASPRWQTNPRCFRGEDEALAELELAPSYAGDLAAHPWHPALLDVALSFYSGLVEGGTGVLPWRYDSVRFLGPLTRRLSSHARQVSRSERALVLDLCVYGETGQPLLLVKSLTLVRATATAVRAPVRPVSVPGRALGLTPAEGADAFLRILSCAEPVVEVCTTDWNVAERVVSLSEPEPVAPSEERQARPSLDSAYVAPASRAQRLVAQAWSEVLGYEKIGLEDDLMELGADSLTALQASARLEKLAGRKMPMETFFEKATVAHIAEAYADLPPTEEEQASQAHWEEGEL